MSRALVTVALLFASSAGSTFANPDGLSMLGCAAGTSFDRAPDAYSGSPLIPVCGSLEQPVWSPPSPEGGWSWSGWTTLSPPAGPSCVLCTWSLYDEARYTAPASPRRSPDVTDAHLQETRRRALRDGRLLLNGIGLIAHAMGSELTWFHYDVLRPGRSFHDCPWLLSLVVRSAA